MSSPPGSAHATHALWLQDKIIAERRKQHKEDFETKAEPQPPGKDRAGRRLAQYVELLSELRGTINASMSERAGGKAFDSSALDAPAEVTRSAVSVTAAKSTASMALEELGLELGGLGGLGLKLLHMVTGGALKAVLAELKTESLHCFLSPLHMCGRYGYEEVCETSSWPFR